jgi:hypothetical protein
VIYTKGVEPRAWNSKIVVAAFAGTTTDVKIFHRARLLIPARGVDDIFQRAAGLEALDLNRHIF